jgi:hypothetical protein
MMLVTDFNGQFVAVIVGPKENERKGSGLFELEGIRKET